MATAVRIGCSDFAKHTGYEDATAFVRWTQAPKDLYDDWRVHWHAVCDDHVPERVRGADPGYVAHDDYPHGPGIDRPAAY
jgi:hypothetical protein